MNRARGNLELGRVARPGIYLEDICFDAQQAAEKAIKAVFVHRGWRFPYIHDLGRLLDLLEEHGEKVPAAVRDSDQLSLYAFATRYPGGHEPMSHEDHRQAVSIAESVVRWAEQIILAPGSELA